MVDKKPPETVVIEGYYSDTESISRNTFLDSTFQYGIRRFELNNLYVTEHSKIWGGVIRGFEVRGVTDVSCGLLFFVKREQWEELKKFMYRINSGEARFINSST
jgi:hypothetical protein